MVFKIDGSHSQKIRMMVGTGNAIYLLLADNVKFFPKNCFFPFLFFSITWIHMCIV